MAVLEPMMLQHEKGKQMETSIKILSATSEIRAVPTCIKVLPRGYVQSAKGNFVVDTESFRLLKNHMDVRKVDIVIDYEHQSLNRTQAPAGGWIKELILKSDGVYAMVEWTEKAKHYLANKEYRYLSPVVFLNNRNNKVVQLHSVALTNTPAIKGMTPIVNPMDIPMDSQNTGTDEEQEICKMLNISYNDYLKYKKERDKDV